MGEIIDKSGPISRFRNDENSSAMGENFKLRWNDHHSIFFRTAESLCRDDHLTDITLSCGKKEFSAHKLVLSVCSSYFKDLFTPKESAKNRPANSAAIVYMKDVKPDHMELLLNFMYRGEINIDETNLWIYLLPPKDYKFAVFTKRRMKKKLKLRSKLRSKNQLKSLMSPPLPAV